MELKPVPKVAKAKNMFPCKGSDVKSLFPEDILTSFERTEVEEFEEVWYLASKEKKYMARAHDREELIQRSRLHHIILQHASESNARCF